MHMLATDDILEEIKNLNEISTFQIELYVQLECTDLTGYEYNPVGSFNQEYYYTFKLVDGRNDLFEIDAYNHKFNKAFECMKLVQQILNIREEINRLIINTCGYRFSECVRSSIGEYLKYYHLSIFNDIKIKNELLKNNAKKLSQIEIENNIMVRQYFTINSRLAKFINIE